MDFSWQDKVVEWGQCINIAGVVFLGYGYDSNQNIIAVKISYEYADDFHYELSIEEWKKFCLRFLKPGDEVESFRAFLNETLNPVRDKHGFVVDLGKFTFEEKMKEAQIHYLKFVFYSYDD